MAKNSGELEGWITPTIKQQELVTNAPNPEIVGLPKDSTPFSEVRTPSKADLKIE